MSPAPQEAGTSSHVRLERRGGVAYVTLDRPAQFNALSLAMLEALHATLGQLAGDASTRVVVVRSRGPAFCPGHDLKEMLAQRDEERLSKLFRTCCDVMLGLTRLPQPVVARVHGVATAAGCQLVAACDLAVASSDAKFATSGINYGLFCATPAVPVSRALGRKHALELLLTGNFIDARTALDWGLVNRVVAPDALDAAVDELCASLLAKPPTALAEGKRFFYGQVGLDMETAYAQAAALLTRQALAAEAHEGLTAFAEKRLPAWLR
jgi:enoyl-CoA hydratase/carnithine racemase